MVRHEAWESTAGFDAITHFKNRPGETNQSAGSCRTACETQQIIKELCVFACWRWASFQVGWRLFIDGFGLAGSIASGLVLGLNGKAVAEYWHYVRCKAGLPWLKVNGGFPRKHQKQSCDTFNLAVSLLAMRLDVHSAMTTMSSSVNNWSEEMWDALTLLWGNYIKL